MESLNNTRLPNAVLALQVAKDLPADCAANDDGSCEFAGCNGLGEVFAAERMPIIINPGYLVCEATGRYCTRRQVATPYGVFPRAEPPCTAETTPPEQAIS
ncbi:MAG TPA: hypothetical protein VLF91_05660 [Candidatus Saccharimonadales bacterium]|nr:hypothetical protein [Candidatus Saccharimonadales bacterium]